MKVLNIEHIVKLACIEGGNQQRDCLLGYGIGAAAVLSAFSPAGIASLVVLVSTNGHCY